MSIKRIKLVTTQRKFMRIIKTATKLLIISLLFIIAGLIVNQRHLEVEKERCEIWHEVYCQNMIAQK